MNDDAPHGGDPLFGARVARLLAALPPGCTPFEAARRLDEELPPELRRRAVQLLELRRRSTARFAPGRLCFLTPKGLEQATPQAMADARARWIVAAGPGATILDATCGIGSDAAALALAGAAVIVADRDRHALRCAAANLRALDFAPRALLADAARPAARADFILLDPDRRAGGARSLDPTRWSPTFAEALAAARRFRGAVLKLAPAFARAAGAAMGPAGPHRGRALLRVVSLGGELVEAGLWLGDLAPEETGAGAPLLAEAVRLDGGGSPHRFGGRGLDARPLSPAAARAIAYLAEPDPAVVEAGLLGSLAADVAMAPLAPRLAYLGGDRPADSPFLRCWPVLGIAPLDPKRVSVLLTSFGIGPITVKKRGLAQTAEALARRLKGRGSAHGLVAVTRLGDDSHVAYLLGAQLPRSD